MSKTRMSPLAFVFAKIFNFYLVISFRDLTISLRASLYTDGRFFAIQKYT